MGQRPQQPQARAILELLDPKSGESLDSDTGGTAHTIINELRKRMEQSNPRNN